MKLLQEEIGWFFAGDGLFSNLSSDLASSIHVFVQVLLTILIGITQLELVSWLVYGLRRKYLNAMDTMLVPRPTGF
ncbi:MAG: hypothetical protein ACFFCS_15940 [Candidatus Hodarchaeota archaeon]